MGLAIRLTAEERRLVERALELYEAFETDADESMSQRELTDDELQVVRRLLARIRPHRTSGE